MANSEQEPGRADLQPESPQEFLFLDKLEISLAHVDDPEMDRFFWDELEGVVREGGGVAIWLDSRDTKEMHYSLVTGWPHNWEESCLELSVVMPLPLFVLEMRIEIENEPGRINSWQHFQTAIERLREVVGEGRIWLGDGDLWRRLHGLRYDRRKVAKGDSDKILRETAFPALSGVIRRLEFIAAGQDETDYGWVGRVLRDLFRKIIPEGMPEGLKDLTGEKLESVVLGGIEGEEMIGVCLGEDLGWRLYYSDKETAAVVAQRAGTGLIRHRGFWSLPPKENG